jgi:mono-ADP-ribosyltransferase sirtuin 6
MDLTAPAIADPEKYDTLDIVERKAQDLADQIKKSKHFIAFTGAGVSTSAGKTLQETFKFTPLLT